MSVDALKKSLSTIKETKCLGCCGTEYHFIYVVELRSSKLPWITSKYRLGNGGWCSSLSPKMEFKPLSVPNIQKINISLSLIFSKGTGPSSLRDKLLWNKSKFKFLLKKLSTSVTPGSQVPWTKPTSVYTASIESKISLKGSRPIIPKLKKVTLKLAAFWEKLMNKVCFSRKIFRKPKRIIAKQWKEKITMLSIDMPCASSKANFLLKAKTKKILRKGLIFSTKLLTLRHHLLKL